MDGKLSLLRELRKKSTKVRVLERELRSLLRTMVQNRPLLKKVESLAPWKDVTDRTRMYLEDCLWYAESFTPTANFRDDLASVDEVLEYATFKMGRLREMCESFDCSRHERYLPGSRLRVFHRAIYGRLRRVCNYLATDVDN